MRWSKLKRDAESRFAEAVRGRIELHSTRYRHAHDAHGRAWLTVDGREIADFSTIVGYCERLAIAHCLRTANGTLNYSLASFYPGYVEADRQAHAITRRAGTITQFEAHDVLEEFLSLAIEDALAFDSPLIRGLAVLDRRTGKRRLRALRTYPDEHPLVRILYEFRCAAEEKPLEERAVRPTY